jgi:hypothetical protein
MQIMPAKRIVLPEFSRHCGHVSNIEALSQIPPTLSCNWVIPRATHTNSCEDEKISLLRPKMF